MLGDWTTLVEWMRADGLAGDLTDPCYADPEVRRARAEHVFDVIDAWGLTRRGEALENEAQLRRLAMAAVRRPSELRADRQLRARGFFTSSGVPGSPFRLGPVPDRITTLPSISRDPAAVLREWRAEPRSAGSTPSVDASRPLSGLRVVDFTWLIAGPTATGVLTDLGADVIKIEHPATADAGDRRAGFTGALNRGKRSVTLDLATPAGQGAAKRLALSADVVVDNFSARVMENWGLDPASLRAEKPPLVCVRMTGFGTTGPDRDQVSFGPTLEARAGFTALMANDTGTPIGFGFSYADVASGHLAALGILAACWRRRRSGEGATLDFSQLEAVAWLLSPAFSESSGTGILPAPDHVYPCAGDDRWIALTVSTDDEWRRFADVAGRPAWTAEARFASCAERARNRSELDTHIAAWTRTQSVATLVARLQEAGVAAGCVADAADLERDPQLHAWGFFATVPTPEGGSVRIAGPPYRLADTPARVSGPGPLLGEHTDAVLRESSRDD
jgi:crotonobetainyl-CoA:carnitine CoA-transferase CaiB-like acyl-CoA transferase